MLYMDSTQQLLASEHESRYYFQGITNAFYSWLDKKLPVPANPLTCVIITSTRPAVKLC